MAEGSVEPGLRPRSNPRVRKEFGRGRSFTAGQESGGRDFRRD